MRGDARADSEATMPTSIWTHAERTARQAIETALRERQATTPEDFWSFYRRWGPACVREALESLPSNRGHERLTSFVQETIERHFAAQPAAA